MAVAHVALDLRPGSQGCHRVHDHHVDSTRAHQSLTDLQALLAGVGLGNQHGVDVHAQGPGIGGIQGMLGVDKGHLAAPLLSLGHHMEGQGGLTGGFRSIDLNDTAPGHTSDAQSQVQGQGAGGDGLHHHVHILSQTHNGALAVGPLDLGHGGLQRFLLIRGGSGALHHRLFGCHI